MQLHPTHLHAKRQLHPTAAQEPTIGAAFMTQTVNLNSEVELGSLLESHRVEQPPEVEIGKLIKSNPNLEQRGAIFSIFFGVSLELISVHQYTHDQH